ncbi:MFS transporter [Runella slithyformis]|uniref:Major facilitator superfamily MFS_1 n=1 Tax=Runella slithyformis (strain ATCC 29530 / DSM 19594 / LMG 11500 / NCIMB 11436 / LSU 4) TaxID=761193 RepID=A0A7U3ZGV6_RUNSL|nr:MFS transporter [Runella slithyformis]AEI46915.1 major facilitator superfamily MFS_1 [Runella slithyformis DSM 19594]
MKKGLFTYENGIVLLMALTFGCLFFDRLALNFLMPYVAKDLQLNNTQIGLLAGALSLAWAFSSFFSTAWAETHNRKKLVFIVAVITFSLCSVGSGWAVSFVTLLIARLVMGFAEGPVIPLAQNFVEKESSPNRLGINAGILQGVGSALFGSILAPVVLVQIAENMGWRNAFFVAGAPGLVLGLLAWKFVKNSTAESAGATVAEASAAQTKESSALNTAELLQYNNIKWGIGAACCVFGWWFAALPFISNYFVNSQGMSADEMGKTMGLLGVSGLLSSIIVPGLSDKIGRKKVLTIFMAVGLFYPFAVYFLAGSAFHLPAMFFTYFTMGAIPLVAAVIPSESVPDHLKAKAIGLITGIAEIVGGVMIPALAGVLSDRIAPSAFLWVAATLAFIGLFFVMKLKEQVKS